MHHIEVVAHSGEQVVHIVVVDTGHIVGRRAAHIVVVVGALAEVDTHMFGEDLGEGIG